MAPGNYAHHDGWPPAREGGWHIFVHPITACESIALDVSPYQHRTAGGHLASGPSLDRDVVCRKSCRQTPFHFTSQPSSLSAVRRWTIVSRRRFSHFLTCAGRIHSAYRELRCDHPACLRAKR